MYFTATDTRAYKDRHEYMRDWGYYFISVSRSDGAEMNDNELVILNTMVTHHYHYNGWNGIFTSCGHDNGEIENELTKLSTLFPDYLIRLTAVGPMIEQVRVEYFFDGKTEEFDDCLCFIPFKKSKLKHLDDYNNTDLPCVCTLSVSGLKNDLTDNEMEILDEMISADTAFFSDSIDHSSDGSCRTGFITIKDRLELVGRWGQTIPEDICSLSELFPNCLFTLTSRYHYTTTFEIVREYFNNGKCQRDQFCVHCPDTTLTLSNCG